MDKLSSWRDRGAEVIGLPTDDRGQLPVKSVLTELGRRGMTNVLVEGGAGTLGSFHDANEIDEVHAFVSPKVFGGLSAPSPIQGLGISDLNDASYLTDLRWEQLGDDLLLHGFVQRNDGRVQ